MDQYSGVSNPPDNGAVTSTASAFDPVPPQLAPVPSAPVPPPQQQTPPAEHLAGRAFGKILSGLSGSHDEYSVDPATGQTTATPVKEAPGQVFRAILAQGLIGAKGIGPQEGQHTFTQGLLSGLSSGTESMQARKDVQDKQRKAQAQEDFANSLKAQESQRQNKELTMREQLNRASIAAYTADTTMKNFQIMEAHQNNQHAGVQTLVNKDAPVIKMYNEADVKPLKTSLNAEDFQKLLAENGNDINAHTVIPVVTNYEPKTNGDGSISWEPIGDLYPAMTQYTPTMIQKLKDSGIKETDPIYKNVENHIKNKDQVDPREVISTLKQINDSFDYRKNNLDIAAKQATIAREGATANAEGIRAKIEKMDLQDRESVHNGQQIFNHVGTDDSFKDPYSGKEIKITPTSNNTYDYGQLSDQGKIALRNYMGSVHEVYQQDYDKLLTAYNKNPDDPQVKKMLMESAETLSSSSHMLSSLTGKKLRPGQGDPNEPLEQPLTIVNQDGKVVQISTAEQLRRANALGLVPTEDGPGTDRLVVDQAGDRITMTRDEYDKHKKQGDSVKILGYAPAPFRPIKQALGIAGQVISQASGLPVSVGSEPSRQSQFSIPGVTAGQMNTMTQQVSPIVQELISSGEKNPARVKDLLATKYKVTDPTYQRIIWHELGMNPPTSSGGSGGNW